MHPVDRATVRAWAAHLAADPDGLEPIALRGGLSAGSLPEAFATAAAGRPTAALDIDGERRPHAQVLAKASRVAAVLHQHGVERGMRVVIRAGTSWDLVIGYLGVLHVGATAVLANPACTGHELAELTARSQARLVLTQHELPSPGERDTVACLLLGTLLDQAEEHDEHPLPALTSQDVALLAFTSGTTGAPKGVPLTHGMLLSSIRGVMRAWRWSEDDVLVHALPLYHQHGLGGLHATLLAGSGATLLSRFDPEALVATVERAGATVLFGVPSIHQRLMSLPPERLSHLGRLRLVTSGSAPLPPRVAEEFARRTGIALLERYGLTESGLDVSNLYDGPRAVGTVGLPLPGVEASLFDAEGRPVPDDASGEIVLRGPQVFDGYLDDPDATAAAFWPGGWFRTGDLGRRDADGRLRVTGRLKELIITGGMNVTPLEVEQVIEQHPAVAEAAVAGTPSERWGEAVTAWVVPSGNSGDARPDEAALVAFCRERLTAYKCPKQVFLVDDLPRNAMGKVLRDRLVAQATGRA